MGYKREAYREGNCVRERRGCREVCYKPPCPELNFQVKSLERLLRFLSSHTLWVGQNMMHESDLKD